MHTSKQGLDLIQHFESCRLTAYPDPKSPLGEACGKVRLRLWEYRQVPSCWQDLPGEPWTIGWGHTGKDIVPGLVWTQEKADHTLVADVSDFEALVAEHVRVAVNQNEYDALVSIVMNVGPGGTTRDGIVRLKSGQPSTLLRLLNAGDYSGCAMQFIRWRSPGSTVEKGLRIRRTAETEMFNGKDWRGALK